MQAAHMSLPLKSQVLHLSFPNVAPFGTRGSFPLAGITQYSPAGATSNILFTRGATHYLSHICRNTCSSPFGYNVPTKNYRPLSLRDGFLGYYPLQTIFHKKPIKSKYKVTKIKNPAFNQNVPKNQQ